MNKRRFFVLLITTLAFLFFVSPALGGWGANWGSGTVIGYGTVTGLKNARKNGATVRATVSSYGAVVSNGQFVGTGSIPGIVWCGNPGANNKLAPGVNPVVLNSNFSGTQLIAGSQIDQNGKAPFNVHAQVDQTTLNAQILASAVCPGGGQNKGTNWVLVDFVPQKFSGLLQGFDSTGTLLTQSVYDCEMPWQVLQSLQYQQQYPYTCTERLDQHVN